MIEKYANQLGWTDCEPHEIVKEVSKITLEIKAMHSEKDESVKMEFQVGGFSAHCLNNYAQKWIITSLDDAPVFRIRYSKAKQTWCDKYGRRYQLSDAPQKFYDYNF